MILIPRPNATPDTENGTDQHILLFEKKETKTILSEEHTNNTMTVLLPGKKKEPPTVGCLGLGAIVVVAIVIGAIAIEALRAGGTLLFDANRESVRTIVQGAPATLHRHHRRGGGFPTASPGFWRSRLTDDGNA